MATHKTLTQLFTAIANALRAKTGGTGKIVADDFPAVIDRLSAAGITPSGSLPITANGSYDVTNYASAEVSVSGASENCVTRTLEIASGLGDAIATINTLITGDSFVKSHYADAGFSVALTSTSPVAGSAGALISVYHCNRALASNSTQWTGHGLFWSDSTTVAAYQIATNVSDFTYQAAFRVNSSGDVVLYLPQNRYLRAGTYQLVLTVAAS